VNAIPDPDSRKKLVLTSENGGAAVNKIQAGPERDIANTELSHRLRALGTLSAALAHEMNNLLTPILGYTRLAMEQPNDPGLQQKALARTHDAAERAVRACDAVMSLARGPESAVAAAPHAAGVAAAVRAAGALMGWTAADADTRLTVSVEPDTLTAGLAPAALEQVLVNLMQNARRAMGPGGAVTVHAHRDPKGHALELTLRDSGPGVPEHCAAMLFEPFVTHPPAAKDPDDRPGTGLGLWISRALLESAGGTIELTPSDPEQPGACFRLRLPGRRSGRDQDRRAA